MKEHRNDMDELFREKMNQMNFDVPEDFLADLNQRLDAVGTNQKKRRKGFFFFYLSAFMLLVSGLLFLNYHDVEKATPNKQSGLSKVKTKGTKSPVNQAILPMASKAEQDIEKSAETQLNKGKTNKASSDKNFNSGKSHDKNRQQKIVPYNNLNRLSTVSDHSPFDAVQATHKLLGSKGEGVFEQVTITEVTTEHGQDGEAIQAAEKSLSELETDQAPENGIENEADVNDTDEQIIAVPTAEQLPISSPQKKVKTLNFSVQLAGGFSYSNPVVRSSSPLNTTINEESQGLWSPSVELGLSMQYGSIVIGVNPLVTQVGEQLKINLQSSQLMDSIYQNGTEWQVVWNDQTLQWDSIIAPNLDTTQVSSTIYQSVESRNAYSRIQIPLNLGYAFGWRSWTFIPSAGVLVDVAMNKKDGVYPNDAANEMIPFQPASFVLSYSLQAEVRRNFGQWHAFIRPRFSSMFSPLIETGSNSRKYNQWNVMLGVGYSIK